jgi:hypothetical protein
MREVNRDHIVGAVYEQQAAASQMVKKGAFNKTNLMHYLSSVY